LEKGGRKMREIKFKGWLSGINKMTYVHTLEELMNWDTDKKDNGTALWLQYTGVHDESDNEIEVYEGDIVSFEYEDKIYKGKVIFEAGSFIIACDDLPDSYITLLDIVNSDRDYFWISGKVIGNIYENQELMTSE
jgi:hypothetical protein